MGYSRRVGRRRRPALHIDSLSSETKPAMSLSVVFRRASFSLLGWRPSVVPLFDLVPPILVHAAPAQPGQSAPADAGSGDTSGAGRTGCGLQSRRRRGFATRCLRSQGRGRPLACGGHSPRRRMDERLARSSSPPRRHSGRPGLRRDFGRLSNGAATQVPGSNSRCKMQASALALRQRRSLPD